jgi:hypothetical protein
MSVIAVRRILAVVVIVVMFVPSGAAAQALDDVWRRFAEKVDVGTELNVRLRDGKRFRATLVGAREEALLLQPKTRVPVPVHAVPYDAIASLERRQQGGIGAAKAAAIGVATGAGAFLAIFAILLANID